LLLWVVGMFEHISLQHKCTRKARGLPMDHRQTSLRLNKK
jgi:hypothetical protein